MSEVRYFTLAGAQPRDAAVARWFESPPNELRASAQRWFQVMRAAGPDVLELMHDGCPTACVGDLPWAYVNAFSSHANVGFFFGATLGDPTRLLEGTGRYMRHVKVRPGDGAIETSLQALISEAYADVKARAATRLRERYS